MTALHRSDRQIVVPFRSSNDSLGPLRWGVREARVSGANLIVLHSSPTAVAVQNGPSQLIAQQLGNPSWATVFGLVQGLGAPANSLTVVECIPESELIGRYVVAGTTLVVGKKRGRWRKSPSVPLGVEVVEVARDWRATAESVSIDNRELHVVH